MFSEAMAKRIEIWPIEKLIPYARNPRTHSEAQVAQIAASIAEFGFVNPILVDTDDGILAGHGRLLGAQKLKLKEVPVIVLDHLTPAQRKAYLLADNKLAELAGWDDDLLRLELHDLQLADFDLGVIGFSDEELLDLARGPGRSRWPDRRGLQDTGPNPKSGPAAVLALLNIFTGVSFPAAGQELPERPCAHRSAIHHPMLRRSRERMSDDGISTRRRSPEKGFRYSRHHPTFLGTSLSGFVCCRVLPRIRNTSVVFTFW
jgi:hypothetical protein